MTSLASRLLPGLLRSHLAVMREEADRELAPPEPESEPRPTADFGSQPSEFDEAYYLGFKLGLDREDAAAPSHFAARDARGFEHGWAAGRMEWDRRLEEMCGSSEYAAFSEGITDRDMYPYGGMS